VKGYYDFERQIAMIEYGKMLSPEVTQTVYAWMAQAVKFALQNQIVAKGAIFDFSKVESFYPGNISTAKTESKGIRNDEAIAQAIARIPIALIATNDHQRMMVGISMKQSKRDTGTENPYVRLVKSREEALAFILNFQHPTP
jgi:hypothetical protein